MKTLSSVHRYQSSELQVFVPELISPERGTKCSGHPNGRKSSPILPNRISLGPSPVSPEDLHQRR